ncbi:hypothetical protein CFC21_036924 [Triticum aestivum]|uniref:CASP-like protein n=3 Tax=Triticum TaxID=4564 RepID=A0A9R0RV16_TRITD|nr:hypothetical protein CFC21_036924 [Triticum aestivum]VAH66372.1 unnamed protein product [Triticum turgidum subsp. durum]
MRITRYNGNTDECRSWHAWERGRVCAPVRRGNRSWRLASQDYLIASMGLQALWSLGLACLDGYALRMKKELNSAVLVSLFVVGDWVTSILSFAASCSAGSVVVLFDKDAYFCSRDPHLPCGTFELATAFAFLSWALSATSALVMFWLLASS